MPLGEVVRISKGSYITKKDVRPGNIPVILGGISPAYWHDEPNHVNEGIVISRSGVNAGFVSYWNEPIFVSDGYILDTQSECLRYVFHYLKKQQTVLNNMKRGSGVPHINGKMLHSLQIPVPSIEERERIVSILDKFDALVNGITQGLPAEIEARRKQYEHYRDKLLAFKEKAA